MKPDLRIEDEDDSKRMRTWSRNLNPIRCNADLTTFSGVVCFPRMRLMFQLRRSLVSLSRIAGEASMTFASSVGMEACKRVGDPEAARASLPDIRFGSEAKILRGEA